MLPNLHHGEFNRFNYVPQNSHIESIKNSADYGDLIKNPNILWHGIHSSLWIIPSICKEGILSTSAARAKKLDIVNNYKDLHRHNGDSYISCARSPTYEHASGCDAGAFALYIKRDISFVIDDIDAIDAHTFKSQQNSGITGEALVSDCIPVNKIVGIAISEDLQDTKITKINFLARGASGNFHLRCQGLLRFLKAEGAVQIDSDLESEVSNSITSEEKRRNLETRCNKLFCEFISKKLAREADAVPLIDAVKFFIPPELKLKIYNTKGFEITQGAPEHKKQSFFQAIWDAFSF